MSSRFFKVKLAAILILLFSISISAQERFFNHNPHVWVYLNLNQTYSATNRSNESRSLYVHDYMTRNNEAPGFNFGWTLSFLKNIGFDFELSTYSLSPDSIDFQAHNRDIYAGNQVRNYVNGNFKIVTFSTGLSYRIEWKNLCLQPKFMIGSSLYREPFFETYLYEDDKHFRTWEYSSEVENKISFAPSININYTIPFSKYFGMGVQVTCEYLYLRPMMKYEIKDYDYLNERITRSYESLRPKISVFSLQAGIFIKIK